MGIMGIVASLIVGALLVAGIRYVLVHSSPPFIPDTKQETLSPPRQAIEGMLTETNGAVKQLVRDASDYTEATPGGKIRQGESLATAIGTATVTLPGMATIALGDHTELSFANLLPSNPLFQQKSGDAEYRTEGTASLSIRVLHSLIVASGLWTLSVNDKTVEATLDHGSLSLGIIDTTNTTHTYTLSEGQTLLVDDNTRSVRIR